MSGTPGVEIAQAQKVRASYLRLHLAAYTTVFFAIYLLTYLSIYYHVTWASVCVLIVGYVAAFIYLSNVLDRSKNMARKLLNGNVQALADGLPNSVKVVLVALVLIAITITAGTILAFNRVLDAASAFTLVVNTIVYIATVTFGTFDTWDSFSTTNS